LYIKTIKIITKAVITKPSRFKTSITTPFVRYLVY
jgi:hypothetical protein